MKDDFAVKDLGNLNYFLGIEVCKNYEGITSCHNEKNTMKKFAGLI